MSKKKQNKSNKKTTAETVRYINGDNCDVLLGKFANIRSRPVAELLNLAFQVFATGVTGIAFPIKENGTASLKKAFTISNSSKHGSETKDKDFVLRQFLGDISEVAKRSKHAGDVFQLNGFDIEIFERWVGTVEVLSIVAIKQQGTGRNEPPKLTYRDDDPFLGPKLAYSIPLIALMAPFKLDPGLYVCASRTFGVDKNTIHRHSSIHVQSDFFSAEVESSKGFHKWLLKHFESICASTATVVYSVNEHHIDAMRWQEHFVDEAGESSLHITPGGSVGRLFLQNIGVLESAENVSEEEFLDAIETFSFMSHPSPNGNNQLKEDWKKSWHEIRPPRSHLTARQVANIKRLASYNIPPNEIPSWVGASSMQQVRRVLRNDSFRDVSAID